MGAGRSSPQELLRIERSIHDHSYDQLPGLQSAIQRSVEGHHKLHLIGLLSDGGVHSHIRHLLHTLQVIRQSLPSSTDPSTYPLYLHCIADGRDTPPQSALTFITQLQKAIKQHGIGHLATLIGRHYAMDRDHRWDRVQAAYDLYTQAKGTPVKEADLHSHIQSAYEQGEEDQTMKGLVVDDGGKIEGEDEVFFWNFRNDRMKEICGAVLGVVNDIHPPPTPIHPHVLCMVQYDESYDKAEVLFPFHAVDRALPEVLSEEGLSQFHCAETEKYAHVTFFFSGGKEKPVKGEVRQLIPSPKVDTYDQQPQMACKQVAEALIKAIKGEQQDQGEEGEEEDKGEQEGQAGKRRGKGGKKGKGKKGKKKQGGGEGEGKGGKAEKEEKGEEEADAGKDGHGEEGEEGPDYDFLLCNLAAADMVGHTGKWDATVKACEAVDEAVGKIAEVVKGMEGCVMLVTGDHGNAEEMLDDKGGVKTAHTTNPVPLIIVGKEYERGGGEGGKGEGDEEEEGRGKRRKKDDTGGGLDDIAPTILALLGIQPPQEMTGHSLLPS